MHAELCPMCKGWKSVYQAEGVDYTVDGGYVISKGKVKCPTCHALGTVFVPDDEQDYAVLRSIAEQEDFEAEVG